MSYLRVNVNDANKEFVEELLLKLGCEVIEEKPQKARKQKESNVSPTMLFGKWKNTDVDPVNFRKKLWVRKK